jgi:hypothetical protein
MLPGAGGSLLERRIMKTIFAAVLGAALLTPVALAQLPAPLEAALSATPQEAQPRGLDFRLEEGGQGVTVRVDLAGEAPAYTLLQPDEAELSEAQQEIWADFLDPEDDVFARQDEDEPVPGLLRPVDLRDIVGDAATLLREENGLSVYGFTPQSMALSMSRDGGDSQTDSMLEHMTGDIAIDSGRNEVAWVHVFAPDSFKPTMAARINTFSMRQSFVQEPAYAAPRLERLELAVSGSAAFQTFEQTMVMEITNLVFAQSETPSSDLGEAIESP